MNHHPRRLRFSKILNLFVHNKSRIFSSFLALGLFTALGLGTLTNLQPALSQSTSEITLVSYAVTKAAYAKIIPKFEEKWKKETG
jgi:ABC-type sulfate transport system substrate-binding protein